MCIGMGRCALDIFCVNSIGTTTAFSEHRMHLKPDQVLCYWIGMVWLQVRGVVERSGPSYIGGHTSAFSQSIAHTDGLCTTRVGNHYGRTVPCLSGRSPHSQRPLHPHILFQNSRPTDFRPFPPCQSLQCVHSKQPPVLDRNQRINKLAMASKYENTAPTKQQHGLDAPVLQDTASQSCISPVSEPPGSEHDGHYGWRFWLIVVSLCFTSLLTAIESTITATTLPSIARVLDSRELYVWFVNAIFLSRYKVLST
jgi:hypothetical protein